MRRTFACLENEGDTFPSWIMDPESRRSKRWADRVVWYSVIVEVAGLAVGSDILAK